jgi:hypothetical protein
MKTIAGELNPYRICSNDAGFPTRKPILNCNPSLKGESNVY